ncbi:hypothetical protein PAHAL_1G414500 [Panicum hallii]|uniref:Uncharacterized protein n=1 Tax=Panicum hallii TaxID=206008 RepID=A0A2T8KXY0_9POAL|nr:hypothetical protein PAHAL_1G414500 [Panicum hallii]
MTPSCSCSTAAGTARRHSGNSTAAGVAAILPPDRPAGHTSQQRYLSARFRFGRDQSSSSSSAASGADRVSASGGAHCGGTNNSAHP